MAGGSSGRVNVPSSWSSTTSLQIPHSSRSFLEIDGQRVKYIGPGTADKDAASVRANYPVPLGPSLYYFEIEVIDKGRNGYVGIGFSAPMVPLNRLPGWEANSYGYHGDDGHAFHESGRGEDYGPKFGKGDIIGALLNRVEKTISFTKNGMDLGIAFRNVHEEPLYPTVGLRTPDEEIVANFGTRKFVAEFGKIQADLAERLKHRIDEEEPAKLIESCHRTTMEAMVMEYLVEKGYWKTAQAAGQDSETAFPVVNQQNLQDMQQRQSVQNFIISGRNQEALHTISDMSPGFLHENAILNFRLQRMVFMEMIEAGNTKEAIAFGKKILAPAAETEALRELLQEALTLLTVKNVKDCPSYQAVLGRDARLKLATDVNSALLRHQGKPGMSLLEKSIRHVEQIKRDLLKAGNPAVGLVNFDEYLTSKPKTN